MKEDFVAVAVDINLLQTQQDEEGEYFRKIAEQGHYAGRTKPTATRQGLYIATVDGTLLASDNTSSSIQVMRLMQKGLNGWNRGGNKRTEKFMDSVSPDERKNVSFPKSGMVLRQTMRDLPRAKSPEHPTWRHNFDHYWMTKQEVDAFVPAKLEVGHKYDIPVEHVTRFVRFHLVDQVKGEAPNWSKENVKKASLAATVKAIQGEKVMIELNGWTRCTQPATGEMNPFNGMRVDRERGVDARITGRAIYDSSAKSFDKFDMLGVGNRWGTATYNFRHKDLQPSSIGFAFEMLPSKPENMIRPKFLYSGYFD